MIFSRRGKLIYKLLILIVLLGMAFSYINLVRLGISSVGASREVFEAHRWYARLTLFLTAFFVACVELGVRMKGGALHDAWFYLHILGAGTFLLLVLVLNLPWFDGLHSSWHGIAGKTSILPFVVMLVTGIPMLLFRF